MLARFCLLLTFLVSELNCYQDDHWDLIWRDEFNGRHLDKQNWDYDYADGCQIGVCGWGNNELQYYTSSRKNSYVKDGLLMIKAREEKIHNKDYSSARLVTRGKAQWRFGKIQIRAKVPRGDGLWPAIWMLPKDNEFGIWPRSGEIDILEILGNDPTTAHFTAHFGEAWNQKSEKTSVVRLDHGSFADDFHIFEIIWDNNRIEWFLDGRSVQVLTSDDVRSPNVYPFNKDFYLIINLAVGGNWAKPPTASTKFPAKLLIDYVRIYNRK